MTTTQWQRGMGGLLTAVLLTACGGAVDLTTEREAGVGPGSGGSGDSGSSGGAGGSGGWAGVNGGSGNAPTADAAPLQLVGTLAYDADPDGVGRAVYLRSLDNDCSQRLTDPAENAKQPAFSADGKWLAYAAQVSGVFQVHVYNLATGAVARVTDLAIGATAPAFSPDGSRLAFVTGDPEVPDNRAPGEGSLMLADLETHAVTMLSDASTLGCCVPQYLSPVFHGNDEILVGTRSSLLGINVMTGQKRDIVPITGRIPNPQDPSLAPDGIRYAFSDRCGGSGLSLYIARIDGSTGDTCSAALPIPSIDSLVSTDWGGYGYLAAEKQLPGHGIVVIRESDFAAAALPIVGARNPAWAPVAATVSVTCH